MLDLRPDTRKLRQFGATALVAFAILGLVLRARGALFGVPLGEAAAPLGLALVALGALSGLFALLWPRGNQPLWVALSVATFPLGWVLSYLVLALLFYGLLTPLGVVFRLLGRDPLERRFEPDRASYWKDLAEIDDDERYFRQF
jgi:hypothetical protein